MGIALGEVAIRHKEDDYDSSPSSSSDSENSENYTSNDTSHKKKHRSKKKKVRHHKKSLKKEDESIKLIPPKEYSGKVDIRSYQRFIMESEAYLRDGKVRKERQLRILAHFLNGKAYDFYVQKVASDNPNNWDLYKFFTELYNYCFPLDYKQQMRLKLDRLHQKSGQSISEHVYELEELFSMVGDIPESLKIIKLWYSIKPSIQKIMWRDGLHPDSSSWDEVLAKAEMVEISDSVIDPRERSYNQNQGNYRFNIASSSNSSRQRYQTPGLSSQTLTPDHRDNKSNYNRTNQGGKGPSYNQTP